MLLSPRNVRSSEGEGARVLADVLRRLLLLPARFRLRVNIGGEAGGSIGAMETLPAIKDTLCCDERRRGRGKDGERDEGGRKQGEEAEDEGAVVKGSERRESWCMRGVDIVGGEGSVGVESKL